MRYRQNGEFEAHVVDFSQFTELNVIRAVTTCHKRNRRLLRRARHDPMPTYRRFDFEIPLLRMGATCRRPHPLGARGLPQTGRTSR
jgi:hypothetical protein